MKRILFFVALVLGVVSCQSDLDDFGANVGGEQEVIVNVSLPEETRANSAEGGISNVIASDEYTVRYIFKVYNADGTQSKEAVKQYSDDKSVSFPVRLVPNRDYRFVVWADIVKESDKADLHYNTSNFPEISLNATWVAMDETRDAYTVSEVVKEFNSTKSISLTLKRPLAKLRVITTDMAELLGLTPKTATVSYVTEHYNTFNALQSEVGDSKVSGYEHDNYTIKEYETTNGKVLFTDYFFAKDDVVKFNMSVVMSDDKSVDRSFNTDIPVKRNHLTTLIGDILTEGNNIVVNVEEGFENSSNTEDAPYHQVAVTSGVGLIKALMQGGEIIILNDIKVTSADLVEATRAAAAVNPVINLNGFTITIENNDDEALVNLNGGTLTVEGEGSIVSNDGALVEGTTVVTEGAEVEAEAAIDENGDSAVKTGVKALAYVLANGGEFTFTENLAISEVLLASTTNPIVINGANFNLTSTASRAIRATVANANIVVNDLNIVVETERVGTNDIRGISIDIVTGVKLTLNNCSVNFNHPSGNDYAYAVNVTGGSNHNVTINGGTYNGANVINVRGSENTVIIKNATLTSLYPNRDIYGACIWVLQEQNSSVYAEGNTFNGDNALAFNLGTGTALEEKDNTDNTKYVVAKVNGAYYYNIAEAIAAAEDGATITVLHSIDCNVGATVPTGKTLTIDLNEKTVNGTDTITGSFGLITNKGNLTVKNGTMTLKAENNREWNAYSSVISNTVGGNLVVENATIEHLGGTDMAYGIDNLTNGKGTYAETTVNEGAVVKSTYRAIRQFLNGIEAQNILTVNAGAVVEGANKSIWMQDPSANANTGKLVVNEGATLNGNVYLYVCAGSTEWPVEVSIAASAVNGEVMTGNVPAGYYVEKNNGVWTVTTYTEVSTADELIKALEAKENVLFKNDIKIDPANMSNAYGTTGINVKYGQTINGGGHTINIAGAGGTWDSGINTTGGLIKDLTVTGSFRGIFINHTSDYSEKVVLDNVTIGDNGTVYTISCDQGLYQGIEAINCTFNGWTSFAKTAGEAKFVNCSFGEGSGYKYCRPYSDTEFVECTFCPGYAVDTTRATITFTDCTWEE
ncbi:MAG: hypothetical protein IKK05_03495 [Alistipes sp.]|nr:hypothetical protein [Alistipes sp.]